MGLDSRVPDTGPGVFPVNLIGKEMLFWREKKLPYPDEICMMWQELWEIAAWEYQYEHHYITNNKRWQESPAGYTLIFNKMLSDLGLGGYKYDWYFHPVNYHAALRKGRPCGTLTPTKEKPPVVMQRAATPYPGSSIPAPPPFAVPNPPRVGQLQVRETTGGQTTIHVLDYPLLYLKDAKDWKYNDTVTIDDREIDSLVDKLLSVKYRIQERRGGE